MLVVLLDVHVPSIVHRPFLPDLSGGRHFVQMRQGGGVVVPTAPLIGVDKQTAGVVDANAKHRRHGPFDGGTTTATGTADAAVTWKRSCHDVCILVVLPSVLWQCSSANRRGVVARAGFEGIELPRKNGTGFTFHDLCALSTLYQPHESSIDFCCYPASSFEAKRPKCIKLNGRFRSRALPAF
jgi:hypothetical protein